jgi:SAM-dependent methyltransferase
MATTKANAEKSLAASRLIQGTQLLHRVRNKIRGPIPIFKLLNRNKERFECPICGYEGPFADFRSIGGFRKHAICPQCGALERHRLQYLVMRDVMSTMPSAKMLHFAPEQFFRPIFSRQFREYETADLFMEDVDHRVDIRNLPFADGSYDLVFASHVLEHISDDIQAVKEIRRVLKPGGMAVLPVPIVSERTIEYPEANPHEAGHVRAPGTDYFEKYLKFFSRVEKRGSNFFPEKYQLFIYEDRTLWPTKECPLRPPMQGEKHSDFVPICYV